MSKFNLLSMAVRALLGLKSALDMEESSLYCGISKSRLYQASGNREIRHYKQFGKVYFKREDLDSWMTSKLVESDENYEKEAFNFVNSK